MSAPEAAVEAARADWEGPAASHLIDTDVHETLNSPADLLPYLPAQWHRHITEYGWSDRDTSLPFNNPSPGRGIRMDAYPPGGGRPGSDLGLFRSQLLDAFGVEVAILCGFFHPASFEGWFELASALASAYNDWQIENFLEKEPRLRGSVHFAVHDPQEAAREIDRVAAHPQIVQAFLPVESIHRWGDPVYRPIFEAAARNQLAIALHHNGKARPSAGYGRYYVEYHSLLPQVHMAQIAGLITSGLFDTYPELKVVVLEGGFTWLPHLMWRMDQHFRQFRSEVPWVKRMPSDYLRENIRLSTQPMELLETAHFLQLLDMAGSDRFLVFSSDYPHYDFDSPRRALPPGLPAELRERIYWKNAAETYGPRLRAPALVD